jgi:hypothetical protein
MIRPHSISPERPLNPDFPNSMPIGFTPTINFTSFPNAVPSSLLHHEEILGTGGFATVY